MSQKVEHKGSLTIELLEKSLRQQEAALFKLIKVEVVGTKTQSTHDDTNPVPSRSLILKEDPNGDLGAPPGTDPNWVVRGEALISGAKKKVAAFRKVAAAAPAPTPPATPAPPAGSPPPAPPAPPAQGGT